MILFLKIRAEQISEKQNKGKETSIGIRVAKNRVHCKYAQNFTFSF